MSAPPAPAPLSPARFAAWERLARPASHARSEHKINTPAAPDGRDRAQADRLARGVLRRRGLLDALLREAALFDFRKTAENLLWVLRLAAFERIFQTSAPDYAIGAEAVTLARRVAGARGAAFVNAVVRRLLPALPESEAALRASDFWKNLPDDVRWFTPRPVIAALLEGYGAPAGRRAVAALADEEAPVWLRANRLRTDVAGLRESLATEEVQTETGPLAESLMWVEGGAAPWLTAAWARGEMTVQDLGSMLAAHVLAPEPGMATLDLCAAPGGKTGHLWEHMNGQGRLVALEWDAARRAELTATLERLYGGARQSSDLSKPSIETPDFDAFVAAPSAIFDRVLVDAPCLALGLIRRHAEARWDGRLRGRERMTATQRDLLTRAAAFVRPGGRLLWMTCSPTLAENEAIVHPWLASRPDWRLCDPLAELGESVRAWVQVREGVLRTRPDLARCDGFACALIERQTE